MDNRLAAIKNILRSQATTEEEQKKLIEELMADHQYTEFDDSYLSALMFPEYSTAVRIPTPFGIPSTLTTQKFSFYVNTGQGDGFIAFLPQDLSFRSVYRSMSGVSNDPVNYPTWTGTNTKLHCVIPVPESDLLNLQNSFTAMRVVGASIRIAYTGTVDAEAGFMVGSHVYDKRACELSEKAIEDGYFVTRTRPSDGVRLVYQPRDQLDFTFQEINRRWADGAAASTVTETFYNAQGQAQPITVNVYNPSDILLGGVAAKDQLDETPNYREYVWKLQQNMALGAEYTVGTQSILNWVQVNAGSEAIRVPIEQMWGMGPRVSQGGACPQILACYYKGLPQNSECLRVDVVRHLECVPRTALKDIVAVQRPVANEESMTIATKIGPVAPVCQSSTLSGAEVVRANVGSALTKSRTGKDFLRNIASRLNPGSWQGPVGEFGRQAIVGASGALFGPEAVPFAEAGMQILKKTSAGEGGPGSAPTSYSGKPNSAIGADVLKFFKQL